MESSSDVVLIRCESISDAKEVHEQSRVFLGEKLTQSLTDNVPQTGVLLIDGSIVGVLAITGIDSSKNSAIASFSKFINLSAKSLDTDVSEFLEESGEWHGGSSKRIYVRKPCEVLTKLLDRLNSEINIGWESLMYELQLEGNASSEKSGQPPPPPLPPRNYHPSASRDRSAHSRASLKRGAPTSKEEDSKNKKIDFDVTNMTYEEYCREHYIRAIDEYRKRRYEGEVAMMAAYASGAAPPYQPPTASSFAPPAYGRAGAR